MGLKTFFCGPESFTPDMAPILGEAPELRGYYVAAGLNSIGILTGGGVGRAMAHWIVHGKPDVDVTQVRVRQWRGGGGITCESVGAASCVSVDAGMGRCAYGFVCGARETRSTTSTDCTSTRATQSTAGRASLRRWAECAFAHDDSGCGCSPLLLLPAAAATAVADAGADAAAVYGASPLIVTVARAAACARTRSYKTHYPAYATATARGVKPSPQALSRGNSQASIRRTSRPARAAQAAAADPDGPAPTTTTSARTSDADATTLHSMLGR